MARGVEEGDRLATFQTHLIGADVLGDPAALATGDIGRTQGVQQRGLAVVDVAHDRHDRRTREQVIVDILFADEPFLDVGFRNPAHGVAKFGRHQFGGVVVDDVVDLEHHALTHQELDDLNAAGRHPVGQFGHGDDVRNDDFASRTGRFLAAALALFTFTFTRPADRGERAHPFDGALIITGHSLDGQAAFATLGRTLDAADRLVGGASGGLAARILFIVGTTTGLTARAGSRTGCALDFRRRRRSVRRAAARRAGPTGTITGTARRRTLRERRITNRFAAGARTIAAALRTITLRPVAVRTVGARTAITTLRAVVFTRRRPLLAATVGARSALTEVGVLETAGRALGTIGRRRGAIVAAFARGFVGAGLAG